MNPPPNRISSRLKVTQLGSFCLSVVIRSLVNSDLQLLSYVISHYHHIQKFQTASSKCSVCWSLFLIKLRALTTKKDSNTGVFL